MRNQTQNKITNLKIDRYLNVLYHIVLKIKMTKCNVQSNLEKYDAMAGGSYTIYKYKSTEI